MEMKWLQTFVVAAKTENFREAAEILYISQPSISVHIQQLETYLHVTLFEREKGKVMLTEEGKFFLEEAEKILRIVNETEQNVKLLANNKTVKLNIVISPMLVETTLPHIIYQYSLENQGYEINLMVEESHRIEELLQSGKAHIGIGLHSSQSSLVESKLLLTSPLVFVIPLDEYDDESGAFYDIDQLFEKYPLLTGHIPSLPYPLEVLVKKRFAASRTISISQSYIVKRFIRDGLGISFLPQFIIRREMMEGRFNVVPFHEFKLPDISVYVMTVRHNKNIIHLRDLILKSYIG
ncbi:LysR family transcriptional regulator [Lysinibacillus sp. 54212]|uniref:LysR family transcriptional regulator n=1 Tax=Lysinibacillus sp. 54212 TaxID=3119829 RepID=UPI002FCC64F4